MAAFPDLYWIVVCSWIAGFIFCFGGGANDVANSFGTSYGARTLNMWQVVILASIFEFAGAFLLGANVADTIRGKIVEVSLFKNEPALLMFAMFCALIGGSIWILLATHWKMPVSWTHSSVGAVIGVGIAAKGFGAVRWGYEGTGVAAIVASWFISPAASALISLLLFVAVRAFILNAENSVVRAIRFFPFFVIFALWYSLFLVLYKGLPGQYSLTTIVDNWTGVKTSGINIVQFMVILCIALGAAIVLGGIVHLLFGGLVKRRVAAFQQRHAAASGTEENTPSALTEKGDSAELLTQTPDAPAATTRTADISDRSMKGRALAYFKTLGIYNAYFGDLIEDAKMSDLRVSRIHEAGINYAADTEFTFQYLQVITACFDAFSHGANDVANGVGALAAVVTIYQTGVADPRVDVPLEVLAMGGLGIVMGLALMGWQIIQALGVRLTRITPSRGFCIEAGTAIIVILFSWLKLPVSTTHCQTGGTIGVGVAENWRTAVNWSYLVVIFAGWVLTLICSATLSGLVFSFAAYSPNVANLITSANNATLF